MCSTSLYVLFVLRSVVMLVPQSMKEGLPAAIKANDVGVPPTTRYACRAGHVRWIVGDGQRDTLGITERDAGCVDSSGHAAHEGDGGAARGGSLREEDPRQAWLITSARSFRTVSACRSSVGADLLCVAPRRPLRCQTETGASSRSVLWESGSVRMNHAGCRTS
jgi:hypothetical protein